MTNAESLASVVEALGGTPSGSTNAQLLAEIVTALGGTPAPGASNDELISQVAENAQGGGGGAWRLWSGDPDAEPLGDQATGKWAVDCEVYARVEVASSDIEGSPVMECWRFWRKGDDAEMVSLPGMSLESMGAVSFPTGFGFLAVPSLTPEGGAVAVTGEYVDGQTLIAAEVETEAAFNDEAQPDRIMVWIRRPGPIE